MPTPAPSSALLLPATPFLRVCLHSLSDLPPSEDRATATGLLEALDRGADVPAALRSQVALFADACDRLGVLRQAGSCRKLTALSLREARRATLIKHDRLQLLEIAVGLSLQPTEFRGPMWGERFYPAADLRHTHALKFAVPDPQAHGALITALQVAGWQNSRFTAPAPGYRWVLTSQAGVEAEIYQQLLPHADPTPPGGAPCDLAFQVAMILCQSHFEPQRLTKRWLCDVAFALAKAEVDTESIAQLITASGLAGSCFRDLAEVLRLTPGSDANTPRRAAADLHQHLSRLHAGRPRNTRAAEVALRAFRGPQRGLVRRGLSAARRLILPPRPEGT